MSEGSHVKAYYEEFTEYLIRDRLTANLRQEAIKGLLERVLQPGWSVFEIGCGIGVLSEVASRRIGDRGELVALDLSEANVRFARRTVRRPNVTFRVGDALEMPAEDRAFDAVLLLDVLEHIPEDRRGELARKIGALLREGSRVVITIPAPEFQLYLREHEPEKLQVVDNVITLEDMLAFGREAGTRVLEWRYVNAFTENQYVHVVLMRDPIYTGRVLHPPLWRRLWWKWIRYGKPANALRKRRYAGAAARGGEAGPG
jgi:trans-aconitate 2-methyltransferase